MEPVSLRGPGIMNPRSIQKPDTSVQRVSDQVAQSLMGWGGEKIQVAANKRAEKDYLEGQMAYQQDMTLDEVEMGGNKWALDGYRFMDAQTISSSLLAAQREQIAQGGHAATPEEFRAQYVNRLDGMLEGKDPRTAELVREQMVAQMPTLVADHTAQHMRYREGQNFESLERSIDVISRDPTATDALVDFAQGGPGSASSGLSDDRRQAAVVQGVVRAFENDNPLAYSALSQAGLLGDNLSTDEIARVRSAQKQFENRRRSEYDEALFSGEQTIMRQVEKAELSPTQAVEELAGLYAQHDIEMNAAEAGAIYSQALTTERQDNATSAVLIEDARLRGDYDTTARITESIMVKHESGGNEYAVSPVGAKGTHQVMDGTNRDPGFGITPARDDSKEERARVGSDYWRAMHHRYKGDLEAVAIAYNAGPGNADKWIAAGRDDSVLPKASETRPYADKIMADADNWRAPTAADKLSLAQTRLETTRERLAIDTYEQIAPVLADADEQFVRGNLTEAAWREERDAAFEQYDVARTRADVNHELSVTGKVSEALHTASVKAVEDGDKEAYRVNLDGANASILQARALYETVVDNPESTPAELAQATELFRGARQAVFDEFGIDVADRKNTSADEAMYTNLRDGIEANKTYSAEQTQIHAAINSGTLADLPKPLQRRAFDQETANIQQTYQTQVDTGRMSVDQANAGIAADINAFYAQSGTVDPRVASRMSAAVLGPLLDENGNPSPAVIDAVQQYAEVKALNPRAADKFLDPEAKVLAAAVLARADDPSLIPEAVRNMGIELTNNPRVENTTEYMARPDVQQAIARETKNFLQERDIGILHAIWQDDATLDQVWDTNRVDRDRIWTPEVAGRLEEELHAEVAAMQRINPNLRPRDLVASAAESLTRRTDIVGGDLVMLSRGQDLGETFFGGRAGDFAHDGAVNSAVMEWLQSPSAQEQYGFISGTTGAERLPGWLQGTINAGLAPARWFGADVNFEPAMSSTDAISTGLTGVRPFRAYPDPTGKTIVLEVLKPDGNYSEPIVVPAREAGELYMERRRGENSR